MKFQNEAYANQKLHTEWGHIEVDADGCVDDLKADAEKFFVNILKFKPIATSKSEQKRLEALKKEEDKKDEKKEDDAADETPVDKDRQSRFSKRVRGEE